MKARAPSTVLQVVPSLVCSVNHTCLGRGTSVTLSDASNVKGEVKAKIKISPVVVFGVLSRMVVVRES